MGWKPATTATPSKGTRLNDCTAASCGDGLVQAGVEACDDGNANQDDACLNDCSAARCGDGQVQVGVEACDDGNRTQTDSCLNNCAAARCGDGQVQAGVEACDDGNAEQGDACLNNCTVASCGDGQVQVGVEACDDGNQTQTDGCLNNCTAARCGDGVVRAGVEACDDGNQNNNDGCTNQCQVSGQVPNFSGETGPAFGDGWLQCAGYYDRPGGDDVPRAWGQPCALNNYNKLRVVCGSSRNSYRYIDVNKNVFRLGLSGYPETNLITDSNFTIQANQIYANGNQPNSGTSWWAGGNGCSESSRNLTVNNSCGWEASNCFGLNHNGNRYLWVYVKP